MWHGLRLLVSLFLHSFSINEHQVSNLLVFVYLKLWSDSVSAPALGRICISCRFALGLLMLLAVKNECARRM